MAGRGSSRSASAARRAVDRKSTRLNSSHSQISYAVFCLKKKKTASTQAAKKVSHMNINGVWDEFPSAKLIVRKKGQKLSALLCSNYPPAIINTDYQGNR